MQRSFLMCQWVLILLLAAESVWGRQAPPEASTASKHAFTAKDWSGLRSAHATAVSRDGSILYHVTFGGEKGPTHSEWWTINADGGQGAKLDVSDDFTPFGFTPDGAGLYGGWKVNKQRQLAVFPLADHKAAAVPSTVVLLPRGIESAAASPDGKHFAIVADPRPTDPLDDVRHVTDAGESSLYVVNIDGTGGRWWCAGLKAISNQLAWSADGASLALVSVLPHIGFHRASAAIDVCSASGVRHITDVPNPATGIAWADSGKEIAFLSTKSEVLTPEHVWTVASSGGTAEDRTPELDGTAFGLAGDPQGRVWVLVGHGVQNDVEEFRDSALKPVYRWQAGVIEDVPAWSEYANGNDHFALTVADPEHASNVAIADGDHLKKITHEGDAELEKVSLGAVRAVHWKSKQGIELEGIATFPEGYSAGKKYPFLVLPHGGPEANDQLRLDAFSRTVAGLGYVVLQPQYRGSTGYGAAFLAAIYQHFGDRAFSDVDSATDFAIEQGWADPKRLAIFGWSAGGFMTSWTVTQTSRYQAAIEGAGITDWGPFLWTSDVAQFDYDASWTDEDPEAFRKFSAVAFANKVTTPLLILHGEADQRVPTFQGVEFFQILAARGKTVRLVTYPGSPHFPVLWEQRLNVFAELTDWLRRYNRATPPTRDPHTPGYVTAKELPDGANAPPNADGNFILGPTHNPAPEMTVQEGVPQGSVFTFNMESADSKLYPGIMREPNTFGTADPNNPYKLNVTTSHPAPYTRKVTVYVPKQYVPGTAAPFIVGADGPDHALFTALDNLIAQHRVPVMIAISINNGGGDAQGSERGLEYDTMSGRYAEFVENEVLPLVEKQYNVKLTKDPDGRATMGGSSGGSCALIMAWYHPELYHRVLTYSGTYVNQQWPWNPQTPHGAWEFHEHLIPNTPAKPIRLWMEVGDRDLYNPNIMQDNMHDWVVANENMAKVLAAKGYHYQFVFARNAGHTDRAVKQQTLPEALEYLWQGYPVASTH